MSKPMNDFRDPFCLGAEQYCHSYQIDGVVGCEDCPEYKGYRYKKDKERVEGVK